MVRRGVFGQLALTVILFVPAATLKFWQGWAFTVVNLINSLIYTRPGAELTMQWEGASMTMGKVNGNTFTMTNEGMVFAYRK